MSEIFTTVSYFFRSKFRRAEKCCPVKIYTHLSPLRRERGIFHGTEFRLGPPFVWKREINKREKMDSKKYK